MRFVYVSAIIFPRSGVAAKPFGKYQNRPFGLGQSAAESTLLILRYHCVAATL